MRKEMTVYIYDNSRFGKVLGYTAKDWDGGDCNEATVLLPEGWDWFENEWGKVLESPDGMRFSVPEAMHQIKGAPYLFGMRLKIIKSERKSIAFTTDDLTY